MIRTVQYTVRKFRVNTPVTLQLERKFVKVIGQVLNVIPVNLTTLGTTVMFSASRAAHCGLVIRRETRFATGTKKVRSKVGFSIMLKNVRPGTYYIRRI